MELPVIGCRPLHAASLSPTMMAHLRKGGLQIPPVGRHDVLLPCSQCEQQVWLSPDLVEQVRSDKATAWCWPCRHAALLLAFGDVVVG